MLSVTKRFTFEAAHNLPNYVGPCHNVHGHSYTLDVTVSGKPCLEGEKFGMIIDFKDLKKIVDDNIVSKLDHSDLNKHFIYPTAEYMVENIAAVIGSKLPKNLTLQSVKLWETSTSYAEWRL